MPINNSIENGNFSDPRYISSISVYNKIFQRNLELAKENKKEDKIYKFMWGECPVVCNGELKEFDLYERLKEIRFNNPILYLIGENDLVSIETAEIYKNMNFNSRVELFKNSSHNFVLEQKDTFLKMLNVFLSENE